RRRHTRFSRDWSSDVCSSDLIIGKCTWLIKLLDLPTFRQEYVKIILTVSNERNSYIHYKWKTEIDSDKILNLDTENNTEAEKLRSEERRVGKECRDRRATNKE